ncbi:MAG TPA: hypothetical protein VMZ28_12580, partial [Kofleriaceae bacterium]|nr:hypothetical protein [Kofleriaceae bacterium]
ITNPKIPWWSSCNPGSPGFDVVFEPIVDELSSAGLELVYEVPLVKQADGDGDPDGDGCHADELFPDGERRTVYLRLGYELRADADHFDRTMQIRNPEGNPSFTGSMSLIGGFVMTAWPDAHYLKRVHRFWRPETSDVEMDWAGDDVLLEGGAWNDLASMEPAATDVLIAWIDQPISLGTSDDPSRRAFTMSHEGPSDNEDVGACLCTVHGAVEMGGGLIHGGVSLPSDGGEETSVARRRLTLPARDGAAAPEAHAYAVPALGHAIGRADAGGWSASTADDSAGALVYGPYATDWGDGSVQAVFDLVLDDTTADDAVVAIIDINDATADEIVGAREIRRRDLHAPMELQRVAVDGDLSGRAGHMMEARLHWKDVSYLRVDAVSVYTSTY